MQGNARNTMNALLSIFRRQLAADVMREQLVEAERLYADHVAAAEMHDGLAGTYARRIQRLRRQMPGEQAAHAPNIVNLAR